MLLVNSEGTRAFNLRNIESLLIEDISKENGYKEDTNKVQIYVKTISGETSLLGSTSKENINEFCNDFYSNYTNFIKKEFLDTSSIFYFNDYC